jgi:DNA repair protein RecN (Recombination protein N)
MLKNLVIENYALIRELNIPFGRGLTIITGETGAGKSIMLGALALILGKRADTSVLYDPQKKCIVEGLFDIRKYKLKVFFNENDLDYDDQVVIRREVSAAGKSRAFVNDLPVTLEVLTDLGNQLIDIHSQNQHLSLSDNRFQLNIVDGFAGAFGILTGYVREYEAYISLLRQFSSLKEEAEKSKSDLDYFSFQYNQLSETHLVAGEQEELEQELEKLTHAEEIKASLINTLNLLSGEGSTILYNLKEAIAQLGRISKYLPVSVEFAKRFETSYIDLKDAVAEVEMQAEKIDHDPVLLESVKDRLDLLYGLQQKHRKATIEELIELRQELENKIQTITSFDSRIEETSRLLDEKKITLQETAGKLSEQRTNAFSSIETRVIAMLREMGMPNASFSIKHRLLPDFSPSGIDQVQFLFSANKNVMPQDISKVASGGELSRLMLSVKSLLSDAMELPTIIFDEIDSGVSGEIAEKVGNIIKRMAGKMQIINITHLPQVASKGDHHLLVYKSENDVTTTTKIKQLTPEERHLEIAKMLSGEEITSAALENARELLKN